MANVKNNHQRRGLALVEMAIVLLLLLVLTFGIVEYGWMFMKAGYVTNAARQGARVGARIDATSADVDAAVQAAMTLGGMQPSVYTVTTLPPDITSLQPGELLRVQVSADYDVIGLHLPLIPKPHTLRSTMVMVREGP